MKPSRLSSIIVVTIFLLSGFLLIYRLFNPRIVIDSYTIWLLGILLALIILPILLNLISRIKRFKFGDNALEIVEKIDELNLSISKTDVGDLIFFENANTLGIPNEVLIRAQNSISEPRGALINIAIEIEARLNELAVKYEIVTPGRFFSPRRTLEALVEKGLITKEIFNLFLSFWEIRNLAFHTVGFNLPKEKMDSLVDSGLKILRFLYSIS